MDSYLDLLCCAQSYLNKLSATESLGILGGCSFVKVAFSVRLMVGHLPLSLSQSLPSFLVSPDFMDSNRQFCKSDLTYTTSRVADIAVYQLSIMRMVFSEDFSCLGFINQFSCKFV